MLRSRVFPALLLIATMLLALPGCDEDKTDIVGSLGCEDCLTDGITGVALDDDGQPVVDAAIGLIYMLDGVELPGDWDTLKPSTQITFELGETDLVRLVIFDNAGMLVRTLVNETTPEIPDVIIWDSLDDDGQMVPVGLYIMHAEFADHTIIERVIFYYDHEIAAFLNKPNAVTDEDGSFRVPRNLIPVGAEIPIYEEDGTFLGLHEIMAEIMVVAVVEYEGTLYHLAEAITLAEDDPRITVNFEFPFPE